MCGICGKYNFNSKEIVEEDTISKMISILYHRGPDDEGCFVDQKVGLGVRRLSIIDASGGHQPMRNEDGNILIVFNGEIYNFPELKERLIKKGHKFYNKSDTEVILHLYEDKGSECLRQLNGMFAFAIWDRKEKRLFIARDRLGIKPLFYTINEGSLIFASEIKSILQDPRITKEVDFTSLHNFLSYNYIPSPRTMFKGIYKLPAGCYMECFKDKISIEKYWDISYENEFSNKEDGYIEELYELLMKSVERRLISDVPLGVFLSGGMDSSTILFCMNKLTDRPIKTFSIGFKERSYDERRFSREIAHYLGTDHHEILLEADWANVLRETIWFSDSLVANTTTLPLYYLSKCAKDSVTVALSGLGGDELIAGYDTYLADILAVYYRKLPKILKEYAMAKFVRMIPTSEKINSLSFKLKYFVNGARYSPERTHYWWRQIFSEDEKKLLYRDCPLKETEMEDPFNIYERYLNQVDTKAIINKFLYADTKVWLSDSELMITDMMGMANSLEIRVPFLDHEIVEFMAKVPIKLKINGFTKKYILKKSMSGKLPRSILKKPKQGFSVPINRWLKNELKQMLLDVLNEKQISRMGYFDQGYIQQLLTDHFSNKADNSRKIWGLLNFFLWHEMFITGNK